MRLADRAELTFSKVASDTYVEGIGRRKITVIVEVSFGEGVFVGESFVGAYREVVLMRSEGIVKEKAARVGVRAGIARRQWIESKVRGDGRVNSNLLVTGAGVAAGSDA